MVSSDPENHDFTKWYDEVEDDDDYRQYNYSDNSQDDWAIWFVVGILVFLLIFAVL